MNLTVATSDLRTAIGLVRPATGDRMTIELLTHVLLEADGSTLRVAATNLVTSLATTIDATIETPGAITLDARLLWDYVSTVDGETIRIRVDEQARRASLTCGQDAARISGLRADDFPAWPAADTAAPPTPVPADLMRDVIRLVPFAAAKDFSRPVLTGIIWQARGGVCTWTSADGFRMSHLRREIAETPEIDVVVPADSLRALESLLPRDDTLVQFRLAANGNQLSAEVGRGKWASVLIEGNHTDPESMIPKTFSTTAHLSTELASRVLRRATAYSSLNRDERERKAVSVAIAPPDGEADGMITIDASTPDRAEMTSVIPSVVTGEPLTARIDGSFLADICSAANRAPMVVSANGPMAAIVFTIPSTPGYAHLVSPMVR